MKSGFYFTLLLMFVSFFAKYRAKAEELWLNKMSVCYLELPLKINVVYLK